MAKDAGKQRRPTLFDYIIDAEKSADKNKYCSKSVLGNEASVEEFFIRRLLKDLGYHDEEIKPKESLDEVAIPKGHKKEKYKPDYVLVTKKPRWLIDAKATNQAVDDWAYQGAGYALHLNQQFSGEDPCQYYVITNGLSFKVWRWNEAEPILVMAFADFVDGNLKFLKLRSLFGAEVVRKGWSSGTKPAKQALITLKKPSIEEVKRVFKHCHDLIWKAEKLNPQPAFFEFVKVMFVKLGEDKKLHEDLELGSLLKVGEPIPLESLVFSTHWVDSMQANGIENPIDEVLFKNLTQTLKEAVAKGKKKPIFNEGETIRLHPGTIRLVVARLEQLDLFGIDEDLNGRLFETFLSATMRGQALGQFFTPRSIVKLMEHMANPRVTISHTDRVLDACCGTGGFLIEALTDMRNQIRSNTSLSSHEAFQLNEKVANQSLLGIDAGKDPPLARIARINMYLHGDGGSRIYAADSLDKKLLDEAGDDAQTKIEREELRGILDGGNQIDIVLTNPPFSMGYSDTLPDEARVLQQYKLSKYGFENTSKHRPSLSSRIMFIERYYDLLEPGGKLLTVIDDSTLSTKNYAFARKFIREKFVVRAVISLPGDAFQRVGARAKTSVLYLVKRKPDELGQPDVFMAESSYIGLDDVPPKTPKSKAEEARVKAESETKNILNAFQQFLEGKKDSYLVPAAAIYDRLDVKACLPRSGDVTIEWKEKGYDVLLLGDIVKHITEGTFKPKKSPDKNFVFLRVRYDGIPEPGESRLGKEITYSQVQHAAKDDLVVSNIAMALGATGVMPAELTDTLVSNEFTIMRVTDKRFEPWFLWGFLRSPEVRARLLSQATGISRHRVTWDFLKEIPVPLVPDDIQKTAAKEYQKAVNAMRKAEESRQSVDANLYGQLDLENGWATQRLRAAKPPK